MKQFFKKSTETIAGMVVGGIAVLTLSSAFAFTLPYTFSKALLAFNKRAVTQGEV
ncbi:MAG: hypothetical protein HQL83_17280 [Magnetococcales bacterium]|nr:hypothetical protein [Magnetococcales bacterium]